MSCYTKSAKGDRGVFFCPTNSRCLRNVPTPLARVRATVGGGFLVSTMPTGVHNNHKGKIKKPRVTVVCPICGTERYYLPGFLRAHPTLRYCSKICASKDAIKEEAHIIVMCSGCGTEFTKRKDHLKQKNYCSRACYQAQHWLEITCDYCRVSFRKRRDRISHRNFCCRACYQKAVDPNTAPDITDKSSYAYQIAYYKDYQRKHRQHLNARSREWNAANKDKKSSINRTWNAANKDKRLASARARRLRAAYGAFTEHDWGRMLELYEGRCLSCGKKEPEIKLTVDHIVPVSSGGEHTWGNIQPLCFNCNRRKGTKAIDYRSAR